MATASDVTIAQDGGGNAKLHPYLIALVRWCVSCLWSTASVFVHRLVTAQLPPITASKQASKPRAAGTDHLHPEPKVECVVLHTPVTPTLDVIFMHGLYGSLGNTWRQGDWRSKYKLDPTKVPLRNHPPQPCSCREQQEQPYTNTSFTYETNLNETEINETVSFQQINGCFKKILPHENSLITEKFYNNTFLNVNNYETQANFVTEMFKNDCNKNCDVNIIKCNVNGDKCNGINKCKCRINKSGELNECNCGVSGEKSKAQCEAGCGCVCDDCYSSCWPRDWIKEDFPGARVISVNYTSDPYLWRPLWVKSCKRLRLHERAEQMISQLLDLGVGQRPIVWVGHSKGGLFIKQIYCQAYEAYMKLNKNINDNKINNNTEDQSNNSDDLDNSYNNSYENTNNLHVQDENELRRNCTNVKMDENNENLMPNDIKSMNNDYYLSKNVEYIDQNTNTSEETENLLNVLRNTDMFGCGETDIRAINEFLDMSIRGGAERADSEASDERNDSFEVVSSNEEEDMSCLASRSSLWEQSVGFMFYSVPHRGSPLAAIKTPITARSIELLEISKDCQLVLELQARWLVATRECPPCVRSLVETCRTLMSVLWLRIVSQDSADAGVGSLCGVSVDHREICKPASRACPLYTELTGLIRLALDRRNCRCRTDSH